MDQSERDGSPADFFSHLLVLWESNWISVKFMLEYVFQRMTISKKKRAYNGVKRSVKFHVVWSDGFQRNLRPQEAKPCGSMLQIQYPTSPFEPLLDSCDRRGDLIWNFRSLEPRPNRSWKVDHHRVHTRRRLFFLIMETCFFFYLIITIRKSA